MISHKMRKKKSQLSLKMKNGEGSVSATDLFDDFNERISDDDSHEDRYVPQASDNPLRFSTRAQETRYVFSLQARQKLSENGVN